MWITWSVDNLTRYVDEIERYFRTRRRLKFDTPSGSDTKTEMGDNDNNYNQPLKEFVVPSGEDPHVSIVRPAIATNNFELKPSLLQIVQQNQFSWNLTNDPNLHLSVLLQFVDILKSDGVNLEAILLRLFPFSLRDRALLQSLSSNSFMIWNELKKTFLARYFLPSKAAQLRNQITCFRQMDDASLFEPWERYKKLMWTCPPHKLEKWMIIHTLNVVEVNNWYCENAH